MHAGQPGNALDDDHFRLLAASRRYLLPHLRTVVVLAVVVCTALCLPVALAQTGLPLPAAEPGASEAAAPPAFDAGATRSHVQEQLARLREQQLERASAEVAPPPAIGETEVDSASRAAALLIATYEEQLDLLAQIEAQGVALQAAETAERDWPGFAGKPPYSILLLDGVRDELDRARAAADLLKASRGVVDIELDRFRATARQAQEAVRRAAEAVERAAPGSGDYATTAWRLAAARGQAQLAAEALVASDLAARLLDEKRAVAALQQKLAQRKLAALAGSVAIGKADIDEASRRLQGLRDQRERELQSLVAAGAKAREERDRASKALQTLRSGPATAPAQEQALLLAQARLRTAELQVQGINHRVRILTVLANPYHDMLLETWNWRLSALEGTDATARQEAQRHLAKAVEYLSLWASRATTEVEQVRAALRVQDQRVQAASDPQIERYERRAQEALLGLDLALERQRDEIAQRLVQLGYWQQEATDALRTRSLPEIGADLWLRLKETARSVWDYELLAIEDKVEVAGKTVTTSRGVTVGKSIGAVLLLLLGYRLLTFLTRRSEGLLMRRFQLGQEQAGTLRRWTNAFGLLALLLLTLNLAQIPLTVFAFAGGALAIGIGFGTQTLIKNLISGMIVLVERNIRVGDIIEVEGVTGTVTAVDVRSSTLRGFDGVESMIPNAMLLEQKVTNWTLTSAKLRRVVKVGVAYGSPLRDAARILARCVERHDAVLKDPAPQVLFEDFGDDACMLGAYFWIDLTPSVSAPLVMSEIRFQVEEEFAKAGIGIAFPQRDVHFDAARPLKVEVVSAAAGGAAG